MTEDGVPERICEDCNGDGFWQQKRCDVHPFQNIWNASYVHPDGRKYPVIETNQMHLVDCMSDTYEFKCCACGGTGWISVKPPETKPSAIKRFKAWIVEALS